MTTVTVATANTYHGRAVQMPNGLGPLSKVDVLLLQEVHEFDKKILIKQLDKVNFRLVCSAPHFGLAIALRRKSLLTYVPRSTKKHRLAKIGTLEQSITKAANRKSYQFTERGLLSAELETPDGFRFTVATVHPTTPVSLRPKARSQQIVRLQKFLCEEYVNNALILGGDMNHHRGPEKVDLALHDATGLTPVDLGYEPTWYVRGSKQEKILSAAARISHRPLDDFNGQHDIILYTSAFFSSPIVEVRDIYSDHRAIIATFTINVGRTIHQPLS